MRLPGPTHRNIYVRSERAGQRVMESITQFITEKLKLKVNEAKSAVARPQERKSLGFSFTAGPKVKRVTHIGNRFWTASKPANYTGDAAHNH